MSKTAIFTLLASGLFFCISEVFIPGGIIGIIGIVCLFIAIIFAFMIGLKFGLYCFFSTLFVGIIFLYICFKFLLKTRFTKGIILDNNESFHGALPESSLYVGQIGISKSVLRPSGIALFDSKRVDVLSEGDSIAENTEIKILEIEGNHVKVTKTE